MQCLVMVMVTLTGVGVTDTAMVGTVARGVAIPTNMMWRKVTVD